MLRKNRELLPLWYVSKLYFDIYSGIYSDIQPSANVSQRETGEADSYFHQTSSCSSMADWSDYSQPTTSTLCSRQQTMWLFCVIIIIFILQFCLVALVVQKLFVLTKLHNKKTLFQCCLKLKVHMHAQIIQLQLLPLPLHKLHNFIFNKKSVQKLVLLHYKLL